MPPSPAMRISPGRELRTESHKRGRSFEGGSLYREKDDDLALFNEVQNKETDNFLLRSNDDFDDLFGTKARGLANHNHRLGISIPARGQSSDLLNAEGDKNDYDWLITPPETPLFSSLDDQTPLVNPATRGRPRAQPISISRSRSPMMEKGYQSRRGSPSPNRLSSSSQSESNTLQSRSRPFSATHPSPPPNLRHSPARGLSPPPSKPKTGPRSRTPTPGRVSTGSIGGRVRGVSPVQTSRGNSASPKLRAWQSNIPGFSLEAPPNLRTSLADRPASYVRGSSPASRTGSRNGRQSMSPTPSRSISSSHSYEKDPFCSYSKGSVASSGDDDVDSLQSAPFSSSDRSAPKSTVGSSNVRVVGFSKKPAKILSSSAPKRSFDMAVRQMERKTPQNMFRPLLSSVPSSNFNAALHHQSLTSINSSITTSSNASSDQGTSGVHETEENEHSHEDVTSNSLRVQYLTSGDMPDEVFVIDQTDGQIEDTEKCVVTESPFSQHDESVTVMEDTVVILDRNFDCTAGDNEPDVLLCSKCGEMFSSSELVMEGELQVCLECRSMDINSTITGPPERVIESNNPTEAVQVHLEHESFAVFDNVASVPESFTVSITSEADVLEKNSGEDRSSSCDKSNQNQGVSPIEGQISYQIVSAEQGENSKLDIAPTPNSQVDFSEGAAGISLLLKRSNSGKQHFVQSRSFTASNISYDDFSYSFGHSSTSVSSSIDMGNSRHTGTYIQRQLSSIKFEMDNYKYEMATKHKRSSSSLSGSSSHVYQVPSVTPSYHGDSCDLGKSSLACGSTEAESTCTDEESDNVLKTVSEETIHLANDRSGENEMTSILVFEDQTSLENNEDLIEKSCDTTETENVSVNKQSLCVGEIDTNEEVRNLSSLDAITEMDIENPDNVSVDSQSDVVSTDSNSSIDEVLETTAVEEHSNGEMMTMDEIDAIDHVHVVSGELTVKLDDQNSSKARSLTLDEATEAILFCSSIVHNLAYKAANIAIDKEIPQHEALQPTLPVPGNSGPVKKETRPRKRSTKSEKARQGKFETEPNPPFTVSETNEKPTQRIIGTPNKADSMKPPKLESKCNCTIM